MSEVNPQVFSAMQTSKPYKTYRKAILGRVYVKYYVSFLNKPSDTILSGRPGEESTLIDTWSEQEDAFFKRMNVNHLKNGVLIPFDRTKHVVESVVNAYNVMTDEGLFELLNSPFFKLQNAINKMTSSAPVYRLLAIAEQEEKSEKIITVIKARLSELELPNAS